MSQLYSLTQNRASKREKEKKDIIRTFESTAGVVATADPKKRGAKSRWAPLLWHNLEAGGGAEKSVVIALGRKRRTRDRVVAFFLVNVSLLLLFCPGIDAYFAFSSVYIFGGF